MGYGEAPWTFKGRCLYQLQLVKSDEARKHIPPELQLVEAFGHTLGGVYLARYDDSPVGAFDECVVMAGLVWNPPTSCAWAARVFVNDARARDHGVASVGLPSRLAAFTLSQSGGSRRQAWWQPHAPASLPGASSSSSSSSRVPEILELRNVQAGAKGLPGRPVALLQLPHWPAAAASGARTGGFLGPRLRLSLPSFSGGTAEHPGLLQYSCDLQTNILPVAPMAISLPGQQKQQQQQQEGKQQHHKQKQYHHRHKQQGHAEVLDTLLNGKPLVCLAFSDMVMRVEEPRKLTLPAPAKQRAPAFAAVLPGGSGASC